MPRDLRSVPGTGSGDPAPTRGDPVPTRGISDDTPPPVDPIGFIPKLTDFGLAKQVEHWKQPDGERIAKRLVVAAMACALVWRLERHPAPEAADLRRLLVRLSGRQMKWGREATAPALLAGLWVLLAMLAVLQEHSVEELRRFQKLALDIAEDESG